MFILSEYSHLLVAIGASVAKLLLLLVTHYDFLARLLHSPGVINSPCLLLLLLDYLVPGSRNGSPDLGVPRDTTGSLGQARLLA